MISAIKISELARITDKPTSVISRFFKDYSDSDVVRINNRITGINPDAAARFLEDVGISYYSQGGVILSANLCGGVGKTSGTNALAACIRRITKTDEPIVLCDTDPQGSLTKSSFGSPASDNELILIDFLEGKASIEQILFPLDNNMWFIKSNLNQAYIDKVLSKPLDIKKGMLRVYNEIFKYLGNKTKIFQDHTPQLSSTFASSVCALHQLEGASLKAVIVPMRSDEYAIDGAEKILDEISDMEETFNLQPNIDIHCYFSSIDKRVSTTSQAISSVRNNNKIIQHLSPAVIRYCVEIPKCIQNSTNVYSNGKSNKAADDYQYLLQSIFDNEIRKSEAA